MEIPKAHATSVSSPNRPASRPSHLLANFGLLAGSLLLVAFLTEVGLRLFYRKPLALADDERTLTYHYDRELGWFPAANSSKRFTGARTITITHNSAGFRDHEPFGGGRMGVIFLGDSLVWGFDVEAQDRFSDKLQAAHPNWNVHNFGVSGYGTDQEHLLLQRHFDQYKPGVVFLLICGDNDNEDNAWNFRGGAYKPFYTIANGALKLNGVPVPKSEKIILAEHKWLTHLYLTRLVTRVYCRWANPKPMKNPDPPTGALILEMRNYVAGKGAFFAVGLQHANADLEKFLQQFSIPFVDLTTTNPAHYYSTHGNHWTPEGHSFVADKINRFLLNNPSN